MMVSHAKHSSTKMRQGYYKKPTVFKLVGAKKFTKLCREYGAELVYGDPLAVKVEDTQYRTLNTEENYPEWLKASDRWIMRKKEEALKEAREEVAVELQAALKAAEAWIEPVRSPPDLSLRLAGIFFIAGFALGAIFM